MKKSFICLLIFIELKYALKVSMFLYCDDFCETIRLDDKIIYNAGYHEIINKGREQYYSIPEFEAERGQIIQIEVMDSYHRGGLRLCGEINIDGYIFSTIDPDYWIEVDNKPGMKFSEQEIDDYIYECIGIYTNVDVDDIRTIEFKFKIPVNLDESKYVRYDKQYKIEDLTYYLIKGESIKIDLAQFVGNNTIKFVHPLKFEFDSLKGSFIYMENNSNVINKGTYPNYKFIYNSSNTNGNYIDTIYYYVYKYNNRIDSENGTIKFIINEENNIFNNINIDCGDKYYIYRGNKKECFDICPEDYPYKIEEDNNKECVKFCKPPYIYLNGDMCIKSCKDENKYINPYTRTCVDNCTVAYLDKYNGETNECMAECNGNAKYKLTGSGNENVCLQDCYSPEYHYTDQSFECTKDCEYNYIDLNSNKCTNACNKFYYIDNDNKHYCVEKCFDNDFKKGSQCVSSCGELYINNNKECIQSCPNGLYYEKETNKYCVDNCDNLFISEDGTKCVSECTKFIKENQCVDKCDDNQFIDENEKNCVDICSNYTNKKLKKCVPNCNGMFIIEDKRECVEKCENEEYILVDNENKYCESENSCKNKNYKIYKGECVKNCPKDYKNLNNYCILDCNNIDNNIIYCQKNKTMLIDFISTNLNEFIENKKDIKGENVDITIIKNNEKIEENPNIQLCLNNLNIKDYIILKINSLNKVEYKPLDLNGKEIDISKCDNEEINIPINENDKNLWEEINKKYNYDIFDSKDKFYNDYCSNYNEGNQDILINDRRKYFYNNYCGKFNCEYLNYSSELKKVNCKCNNDLSSFSIDENYDINNNNSFKNDSIKTTNIAVMTCWKNLKNINIKNNFGFLPITSLITAKIIVFIYLKLFIKKSLNNKCISNFQSGNPPKKLVLKDTYIEDSKINKEKYPSNSSINGLKSKSSPRLKKIIKTNEPRNEENKIYNINITSFKYAIKFDKRKFCQILFSIISYKSEIIKIFVKKNPFDLFSIKIISYLTRIVILYIFNIILFVDSFISNIYKEGKFKRITISNIIISLIGWIIFEIISKLFSIYLDNTYNTAFELMKDYYPDKKDENLLERNKKYINKRLTIFFIIEFFILLFSLYYSSVYGTVFKNSQRYCLFNTLLGISYNIIFGIIISIILTIIRYRALKSQSLKLYNIFICLWKIY